MEILVTGATGFVGRHVAAALAARGHGLRCLVRDPTRAGHLAEAGHTLCPGRLLDGDSLREAARGVDGVVHVAGLVRARSFAELRRVNAEGAARIARVARQEAAPGARFLLVSSQAAAGPSVPGSSRREDDPPGPVSWYGWSKLLGERAVGRVFGPRGPLTVVRPPAVYGPHDRDIFEGFAAARRGVRLRVGSRRRDISLVHVEDLAVGIADAFEAPAAEGRTYFLSNPRPETLELLLARIARAVGRRGLRLTVPEPVVWAAAVLVEEVSRLRGRVPTFSRDKAREFLAQGWACDPSRARTDLGWEARIDLDQGLAGTAAWYRERGWM